MPRRPRGVIVESIAHVTSRGNRGAPIYLREQDYRTFLAFLREYLDLHEAQLHGFCLMTNHFHLIIEVGSTSLSVLMHALLNRFVKYFNRVHGFHGHLFGGRFWSKVCDTDTYALSMVGYIHLNPCRAGITSDPSAYEWSTHRVFLGTLDVPWVTTRLLDLFSANRRRAHEAYARFIADEEGEPFRDRVFE